MAVISFSFLIVSIVIKALAQLPIAVIQQYIFETNDNSYVYLSKIFISINQLSRILSACLFNYAILSNLT